MKLIGMLVDKDGRENKFLDKDRQQRKAQKLKEVKLSKDVS